MFIINSAGFHTLRTSHNSLMSKFDYIIAGAGCAGLSLAFYMSISKAENLKNKKILLIDKVQKTTNDRTWSFWKDNNLPFEFEEIIHKKWGNIYFFGEDFSDKINISPYNYNTIRSIDFYDFTKKIISQNSDIQVVYEEIQEIGEMDLEGNSYAFVRTNTPTGTHTYKADFVFNSTNLFYETEKKAGYHYFLQHFKGWFVETKTDFFDEKTAHFMDFRVPQMPKEARFCYILPFSPTKALIEFTVFSENLLEQNNENNSNNEYDTQLKNYIENIIQLSDYKIVEEEFGVIPMYDFAHKKQIGNRIINIGTTGGQVKASTGYAFLRIQARTKAIIKALSMTGKPFYKENNAKKYQLYDSALLHVMANQKDNNGLSMKKIFTILFEKLPIQGLFRFLDEKTNILEDIKLMSKVPSMPFIRAILENFWKQKL